MRVFYLSSVVHCTRELITKGYSSVYPTPLRGVHHSLQSHAHGYVWHANSMLIGSILLPRWRSEDLGLLSLRKDETTGVG